MIHKAIVVLAILLGSESFPGIGLAQVDCSPLDPRDSISKEREGTLKGSIDTFYKVAKAEGNLEAKVKEKIQNLQEGVPVSEKNQIKLRTIYMFCGMIANDKALAPERKVTLFNLMMGIKDRDTTPSAPNTKKKSSKVIPKAPPLTSSSKAESERVVTGGKQAEGVDPAALVSTDFSVYEAERLKTGMSLPFFIKNAPIHYRIWLKEAERGNAMAQVLVGRALAEGVGVSKDAGESVKWLERAADQGNAAGQFTLGNHYQVGWGVIKDQTIALSYLEQAAKQKHPGALRLVGDFSRWGFADKRSNPQKALELYEQAIGLGDTGAMIQAASLYLEYASSFPEGREKAKQLYKKAASLGNETAKGIVISRKMAEQLETYAAGGIDPSARKSFLEKTRLIANDANEIAISGLVNGFDNFEVYSAIEKILKSDASDPMREILNHLLNAVAEKFRVSDRKTREIHLKVFSKIVNANMSKLVEAGKYGTLPELCKDIYSGLDLSQQTMGDQSGTIKLLAACSKPLSVAGYRTEVIRLANNAVTMVDTILRERPWDWWLTHEAIGFNWGVGALLLDMQELEQSQMLLTRAWNLTFKRFGREDLIGRYTTLPTKGKFPIDVREEDRDFFRAFAENTKEEDKKYHIRPFTIPAIYNEAKHPFTVFILTGSRGYQGIQDQFVWLRNYYDWQIPSEVQQSYYSFNQLSITNHADFGELCEYGWGDEKNISSVAVGRFDELFKDDDATILLQGKNRSGTKLYSYVNVSLRNIKRLYSALQSERDFNPGEFGTVVAEGEWEPSEELQAKMKSKFPEASEEIASTVFRRKEDSPKK